MEDDPKAVAEVIKQHDPTALMMVLFLSAPPCPDFSRIREDGQKFTSYCGFVSNIEMNIPNKRVGHLVENVVMARGGADHFSSLLAATWC